MSLPFTAVSFLLGIVTLQYFSQLPAAGWLTLLLPVLMAIWLSRARWLSLVMVYAAGLLWALLAAHWYGLQLLPEAQAGQPMWVEGVVSDIVHHDGHIQRFELEVRQLQAETTWSPGKLRLSWYSAPTRVQAGERWRLLVKLKPPHGSLNPGGFDYEKWLYQQGIHATGYVRKHVQNQRMAKAPLYSVAAVRQHIMDFIQQHSAAFSGLLAALAVGHKALITPAQWDLLIVTGTNHLMAISGLHIGLVAAIVFWLVRRGLPAICLRRYSADQLAAALALVFALAYALLAGFAIPTQRALVMLLVVLGAVLLKKPVRPLNSLSMALLLVLLIDPVAVLSAGFWFSFAAVAVIAYSLGGRLGRPRLLWQWGHLQWVIALMLLPVSLFMFQQSSLVAPLANMVLVPWVSFLVVPLVLLSLPFIWLMPSLAGLLLQLAQWSISMVWPLLQWLGQLPLASWQQAAPSLPLLVLALLGVMLLLAPRGVPQRWLGLLLLLPALWVQPSKPATGEFWMTLLDVGQGLSVLVQTRDHQLLFDTGARFSERFDMGDRVVLPLLRSRGLDQLHMLIVSHGDNDHKGGAHSILQKLPVSELRGQDLDELSHANSRSCAAGQSWQWDGVQFSMLHPDREYAERNNHACVLRISNARFSLLIAADIEARVEQAMLRRIASKLPADVLIVPHHGSKTSSTAAWLDAVAPQYALVSAGYRNRFGHPAEAVVARYAERNIRLLNTADSGAIHMVFGLPGSLLQVHSYRQQHRRYWHHSPLR